MKHSLSENQNQSILKQVEEIKKNVRTNKTDKKILEIYCITDDLLRTEYFIESHGYSTDTGDLLLTDCAFLEEAKSLPREKNNTEDIELDSNDEFNKYYLKLKSGNSFIIIFTGAGSYGQIELLFNEKRVAQISIVDHQDGWNVNDTKAYIDGEWVAILEDLLKTFKNAQKEKRKIYIESKKKEKIDKLKKDFGLE